MELHEITTSHVKRKSSKKNELTNANDGFLQLSSIEHTISRV